MSTPNQASSGRRGRRLLLLALSVALAASMVAVGVGACEDGSAQNVVTSTGSSSITWGGNGSGNNCEEGGSLHWILTVGGNVTLVSGTLHVQYADGTSGNYSGYFPGGGSGAMHFDSTGDAQVTGASADFIYAGNPGNQVLTISHSTCNSGTTTTVGDTTTTVGDTTTTVGDTTTTSVGSVTSTTARNDTTTTSVGSATSTTASGSSTTTSVGSATSTTSTVVGDLTTVRNIDTGYGGTAGPNVAVWTVVGLLVALAAVLGGSAVVSVARQKDDRRN